MTSQLRVIIWNAVSSRAQAEKDSLPETERMLRAVAEANNWRVTDVLTVRGHTRSYVDFYDMAEDAQRVGIPAFYQLRDHWQRRDFDILLARDGDRFARDPAPIALIFGKVLEAGARIYTVQDKWIDQQTRLMSTAMIGYRAASEVSSMKTRQKLAKDARAQRGIPVGAFAPFGFVKVRDESGRLLGIEQDISLRVVLDVAAEIVLSRVSWLYVESEMAERGYVDPRSGRPFKRYFFYKVMHSPWTWGHGARRYRNMTYPHGQKVELWTVEPGHTIPADALIKYDTHKPLYTGELALKLKAEIRRRHRMLGGTTASTSHPFTRLLLCGYCGFTMSFRRARRGNGAYACRSKLHARTEERPGCDRNRQIKADIVQDWLDLQLRAALANDDYGVLARAKEDTTLADRATALQVQSDSLYAQVDMLILKQATAPPLMSERYDAAIAQLSQQISDIDRQLLEVKTAIGRADLRDVRNAFEQLKTLDSLETFWAQDGAEINALLRRLLGERRLVIKDNQVVGTADAPPHYMLRHGQRRKQSRHPHSRPE